MSLSHRRSPKAFARRIALLTAFYDRQIKETVCLTSTPQIIEAVAREYGEVDISVCRFERGEVLIDNRGTGSLQR